MCKLPAEAVDEPIKVLAVDGDIIAYRTAAVCENDFEGACASIIDSTLRDISTETGINYMRIYLSGEDNFRYEVAKTKPYKGNRAGMVLPQFLNFCKTYMEEKYLAVRMHGYEADDGVATDMVVNKAIHCGIDKDIRQIAGVHYNYVNKEFLEVTPEEAEMALWRQVLTGDTSDNVPGLPRVGEKTAEKIITSAETAEADAIAFYVEKVKESLPHLDPYEYLEEQKKLIQMVTDVRLDFKNTVYIEPNTEGFSVEAGDDIVESKAANAVRNVRL